MPWRSCQPTRRLQQALDLLRSSANQPPLPVVAGGARVKRYSCLRHLFRQYGIGQRTDIDRKVSILPLDDLLRVAGHPGEDISRILGKVRSNEADPVRPVDRLQIER